MFRVLGQSRMAWLGIGLIAGLVLSNSWPESPLHAVATDRYETFAMATGPVDEEVEAVYFLDFLTGDLNAVVLGRAGSMFTAFYRYNVLNDLGIDPAKNPHYMMATGMHNLQRGAARMQPSLAVVYVAEITTGKVAAYALPWNRAAHASGTPVGPMQLWPLAVTRFRAAAGAPGAGPASTTP